MFICVCCRNTAQVVLVRLKHTRLHAVTAAPVIIISSTIAMLSIRCSDTDMILQLHADASTHGAVNAVDIDRLAVVLS